MKKKQVVGIIVACAALLVTAALGFILTSSIEGAVSSAFGSVMGGSAQDIRPTVSYIGVVPIEGSIGATENYIRGETVIGSTVDYIESYKYDPHNTGIMLYIDSPGGGVNETDEIYLALLDYKKETGRPVYAWCNDYCASGAYYIACAADRISVMRNTWIGSIGVYIQVVNYADLMKNLGVEGLYIRSSDNKAMGNEFDHLTEEQYAIYQGLVDDSYEQFLSIVMEGRGYTDVEELKKIADGRIYTAKQAIENGLADKVESYQQALDALMLETDAVTVYTPVPVYTTSLLDLFMGRAKEVMPKSDLQAALEAVDKWEVKLYYGAF